MYIDLQTHTTASDGKLTPTELVLKAKKLGFSYIAKTDHDNVNLMKEFLAAGKKFGVHTISGIEISSRYQGKSLHILGLGIDYKNKKIIDYTKKVAGIRRKRAQLMIEKLKKLGWQIKKDEIQKKIITRPHVALTVLRHPINKKRLLDEFNCLPDFSSFIKKYLVKGTPGFIPKPFYLPARQVIRMIKKAGGLSILAHPCSKSPEFNYSKKHLQKLARLNFDGIEIYSPSNTRTEIKYLKSLIKKYNLLASAGSDFHGHDKIQPLGICYNGKYIKEQKCKELLLHLN